MTGRSSEHTRYDVSIDEYKSFRSNGFLAVRNLVSPEEVEELRTHTEDLMQGRLPEQQGKQMSKRDTSGDSAITVQGLEAPPENLSPVEKAAYFLRIHMLHRKLPLHERYLLHPRVLDVLEVLIGPDVLALQTMLFLKPPGKPGQGWHQDSYYIPTHPDTLCGAWIAIDDCDEQNGALWFAKRSGREPVYPPCPEQSYGFGDRLVRDISYVSGASDPDDSKNMLSKVAEPYDQVLVSVKAGDVVFFNGHVLHRSKQNWSTDRFRRAFVGHYCNARSFTQWGADTAGYTDENPYKPNAIHEWPPQDATTGMTNGSHILARGDTHLPFARPRFDTPCAATESAASRAARYSEAARRIAVNGDGLLGCAIADPDRIEDASALKPAGADGGY